MSSFIVGYISTILILLASRRSYKKYVLQKVEEKKTDEVAIDNEIDKKEQRREIVKTVPNFFSLLRLGAYIIFIIMFFYLRDNQLLQIGLYLTGITLAILTTTLIK